jgi:hypothetical protein
MRLGVASPRSIVASQQCGNNYPKGQKSSSPPYLPPEVSDKGQPFTKGHARATTWQARIPARCPPRPVGNRLAAKIPALTPMQHGSMAALDRTGSVLTAALAGARGPDSSTSQDRPCCSDWHLPYRVLHRASPRLGSRATWLRRKIRGQTVARTAAWPGRTATRIRWSAEVILIESQLEEPHWHHCRERRKRLHRQHC